MDPTNIKELIHSFLVEALKFRYWIAGIFIVVSAAVLVAGFMAPKAYKSGVVLYADRTNIIGGLLAGSAQITKIDHAREIRNIIYTNRMMTATAVQAGFENPEASIDSLRRAISVRARGDYVDIEYTSDSQEQSFKVISAVTDLFIKESARKKREESEGAYEFIDAQVNTYKAQLEESEQRLKEFRSENIDISEGSVATRVSSLKREIQGLELSLEDSVARLASFERQLAQEPQLMQVEVRAQETRQERQLQDYETQLSNLRLTYLDTHPDIVSLTSQMEGLKAQIAAYKADGSNRVFEQVENPSYTNLNQAVNNERASVTATRQRLSSLNRLLDIELANADVAAEKQAIFTELTRDYGVTKNVYDDMLQRREKARLSMTLDAQGQGVSYKIHEPPLYPIESEGAKLIMYAAAGPVFGMGLPLGLILVLIVLEPKVRSSSFMEQNLPPNIEFITTVPAYNNVVSEYASKRSLILLFAGLVVYMALYALLGLGIDATSLNLSLG